MAIRDEILTELLAECRSPEEMFGKEGLLRQLTGRLLERMLGAELDQHLTAEQAAAAVESGRNSRNGYSEKTVVTEGGEVTIKIPRDRKGTFEPQVVKKHQRRLDGFDEKVISLYARGMTVREIQGHLEELYGTEVSPDLISRVTDGVLDQVRDWQGRRLEAVWPIVYLDALIVKVRDQGQVRNKAAYLAIGVGLDGRKEVLGLWLENAEGAKLWLKVVTELKNRGVDDMLIVCCDGLKGFPEAIEAVYPRATVQTCVVHLIRNALRYVSYKDLKAVASDLRPIYQSSTEEEAEQKLAAFEEDWGSKYPMVAKVWRARWTQFAPFLAFSPAIRRVIYTTNAIESLNFQLRKIIKARGHFPTDDAACKLLWLALDRAQRSWSMPIRDWPRALHELSLRFEGRLPM